MSPDAAVDSAGSRRSRGVLRCLDSVGTARTVVRRLRRARKAGRRARRRSIKRARRSVHALRRELSRRHLSSLKRDWRALTTPGLYRGRRRKAIYGSRLKIAADLTKELLILNTGTMRGSGDTLVVSRESKSNVMSGVYGLKWFPTGEEVLRRTLGVAFLTRA